MPKSRQVFRILLAFLLLSSTTTFAQSLTTSPAEAPAEKPVHWGLHGMLVFGGNDGLYASHLPMFHAPHDRQVIFRFHLSDVKNDTALRTSLANSPEVWSIEPEEFDLDRLQTKAVETLRQFSGNVVQGHFERGGTTRFPAQKIIVDEILVFNPLSPTMRHHSNGIYYLIGHGREKFLMKKIDRRPDFDVLIALKTDNGALSTKLPAQIQLPSEQLKAPVPTTVARAIRQQLGKKLAVATVIYFETDDLK